MTLDDGIVLDQRLRISDAITSNRSSSVDEGVVMMIVLSLPARPGVKHGPEEPRRKDASCQVVKRLNS
jgi:hypothetical protein